MSPQQHTSAAIDVSFPFPILHNGLHYESRGVGATTIPIIVSADVDWNDLRRTRLDPFLRKLHRSMVEATAYSMNAIINGYSQSMVGFATDATRVLLGLNLEDFCRDVVVAMVEHHHAASVAKVQRQAIKSGAERLVQQLSVALLCSGHIQHACLVTNAFVEQCLQAGVGHREIASYLAPAVILAVDSHHGWAVARVQKSMIDMGQFDIVVELILHIACESGRPDVVARGTLAAIDDEEIRGIEMASSVAAAAFCRHNGKVEYHTYIAHAASMMYRESRVFRMVDGGGVEVQEEEDLDKPHIHEYHVNHEYFHRRSRVCKTIALAAVEGVVTHSSPLDVVKVSDEMWRGGQGHAVTLAMRFLAKNPNHARVGGVIACTAMLHGYVRVALWLLLDMIHFGYLYTCVVVGLWSLCELVLTLLILPRMIFQFMILSSRRFGRTSKGKGCVRTGLCGWSPGGGMDASALRSHPLQMNESILD